MSTEDLDNQDYSKDEASYRADDHEDSHIHDQTSTSYSPATTTPDFNDTIAHTNSDAQNVRKQSVQFVSSNQIGESDLDVIDEDNKSGTFSSKSDKKKANIFYELTEYEQQRCLRYKELHSVCDPVIAQIESHIQQAKHITSQICKYMRERVKQYSDYAAKHKSSVNQVRSTETIASHEAEEHADADVSAGRKSLEEHLVPSNASVSEMASWLNALYQSSDSEAKAYEFLSETIEEEVVNVLQNDLDQTLQKSAMGALNKIIEGRCKVEKQHKEALKNWTDLEKHYKHQLEKVVRKKNGTNHSSFSAKTDIWIYERRYLVSATILHKQYSVYNQCFVEAIDALKQFEQQRSRTLREAILRTIETLRSALSASAINLGDLHSKIDPQGFSEARKVFIDQQESLTKKIRDTPDDTEPVISSLEEQAYHENEAEQSSNQAESEFFYHFKWIINSSIPPQSHFILKKGFVKRQSASNGIFTKWSDGLLVLTWDRYLHMFRSHDDLQPVWSIYIPHIEIRTIEEKNQKNIELRDKKNFLSMLSRQCFTFQPRTNLDLQSWTSCLQLASNAADDEYHDETEMIVKSVDAQEMRNYSLQIQQQEEHTI